MEDVFVIVSKDENGNVKKSSNYSFEEANKYCLYLEILNGFKTHIVISLKDFENGDIPKNLAEAKTKPGL